MSKSLGKSIINLYSNLACSVLGVGNKQELSTDLECDPFLNTAMQRFTCNLYYRFGALLAPISVGIITGKHYAKNSKNMSNYVYAGSLSVLGLAISGYLLYNKFKKPKQNLIDVPPPPLPKTSTEPKRDIFEML